jgi:hypothetical protein
VALQLHRTQLLQPVSATNCRFSEHDEEVVFLTFSHDDRLLLTAGHEEK